MSDNKFGWTAFYSEFADKLLAYRNDRKALIDKIIGMYNALAMTLPTLEQKGHDVTDIDPFTTFGLFNKGISDDNRRAICKEISETFEISAALPTDFAGIPVLNNKNSTFYRFAGERAVGDIENLWRLFADAIAFADSPNDVSKTEFISAYNAALSQKGIKWNITIGLYWCRPNSYLSLDGRNRWYLLQNGNMSNGFSDKIKHINLNDTAAAAVSGEEYVRLMDAARGEFYTQNSPFHSFPELSLKAWLDSEQENLRRKQLVELNNADGNDSGQSGVGDPGVRETRYWLYAPGHNAAKWDEYYDNGIMGIGWGESGDIRQFLDKEEIKKRLKECYGEESSYRNAALALWQFANEMREGDVVFAKNGMNVIVGRGIVSSDYRYDADADGYNHIRGVKWTHKGEWAHPGQAAMKTLTDITPYADYVANLNAVFQTEDIVCADAVGEQEEPRYPSYGESDFLLEVFMDEAQYRRIVSILGRKKNIILHGPPGTGKTFAAKRLAYSMMGVKDTSRVSLIQLHQSYSYEDFIMGYRPSADGFELRTGAFYDFCMKARDDDERDYFFIIDEINRGNLSKIFGELFMLIEKDKRNTPLRLLYRDELFSVPKNLYIIGLMNTADRSLAMMDYALRRRFAFINFAPAFGRESFKAYLAYKGSQKIEKLAATVARLNEAIADDAALGDGFRIGHSYLCTSDEVTDEWLRDVMEFELVPLLEEYWYDEPSKAEEWASALKEALK